MGELSVLICTKCTHMVKVVTIADLLNVGMLITPHWKVL